MDRMDVIAVAGSRPDSAGRDLIGLSQCSNTVTESWLSPGQLHAGHADEDPRHFGGVLTDDTPDGGICALCMHARLFSESG